MCIDGSCEYYIIIACPVGTTEIETWAIRNFGNGKIFIALVLSIKLYKQMALFFIPPFVPIPNETIENPGLVFWFFFFGCLLLKRINKQLGKTLLPYSIAFAIRSPARIGCTGK